MRKTLHKEKVSSETTWEPEHRWYQRLVGEEGHYYHQKIIIPKIIGLIDFEAHPQASVLDLACGQGILARNLPTHIKYVGLDLSPSLIKEAKRLDSNPQHAFYVADVTKNLPLGGEKFSHATILLALQNIEHPLLTLKNAFKHLVTEGNLIVVLNHPCFRIPRQSSWQVDSEKKLQYRRIDRYFSSMKIPIQTHPSKGTRSSTLISFHHPLSTYAQWLYEAGFLIEKIEEWCSDRVSTGKSAKMENRSREEFPLFLVILAKKKRGHETSSNR